MSDPRLTLVPVGVGTAYAATGEAQSCYLVRAGGRCVVVDLGSGALNRLQRHVAPHEPEAVIVTHMHPDHCVDLLSLRIHMMWGPGAGRVMRVIGPPGLRDRLAAFSGSDGWDTSFRFEEFSPGAGAVDLGGGLVMRHREVPHLAPTNAVRLEFRGASVVVGSDCAPNDALPDLAAGCDVLVCECTFGAGPVPDGVPHLDARGAGAIAARAGARRLLLTHCQPEFDRDAALAGARAAFGGPVDWARQDEPVAA